MVLTFARRVVVAEALYRHPKPFWILGLRRGKARGAQVFGSRGGSIYVCMYDAGAVGFKV